MRILFVSNFYPPQSLGGVQLYTHGIARELLQRGCYVHVLAAGEWDRGPAHFNGAVDDIHEGVAVRRLNLNWRKAPDPFRYLYNNPIVRSEMERLLTEFRPDVVHITSPSHLSVSTIFAAKAAGLPVVLTLADFWLICPRFTLEHADGRICNANVTPWQCTQCLAWNAKIHRWPRRILSEDAVRWVFAWIGRYPTLTRQKGLIGMIGDMDDRRETIHRAFAAADVVLAISRYVKATFVGSGHVDADRIRVHEWGLSEISIPTRSPRKSDVPLRFAYFGRLVPSKGVHILIQAFRQLRGQLELHLYGGTGDGPEEYEHELRRLSAGDYRIRYHGPYRRDDMSALLAQSDVVVVPSVCPETYNLVAREALMAGVPVVASNIGALPDAIWHERNGLLVKPNDAADLAVALQRLVDDSALREHLANGPRNLKTLEKEVDELVSIYRSLLARA